MKDVSSSNKTNSLVCSFLFCEVGFHIIVEVLFKIFFYFLNFIFNMSLKFFLFFLKYDTTTKTNTDLDKNFENLAKKYIQTTLWTSQTQIR
jgi:hypothetical protein